VQKVRGVMLRILLAVSAMMTLLCCVSSNERSATNAQRTDFTPESEYFIGRAVSARILARYEVYQNDSATQYVNLIGQVLGMFSG
jgi:hypothetical protein